MAPPISAVTPDPVRASRAIGAFFLGAFGGVWVALWAWDSFRRRAAALFIVAAVTSCLLVFIHRRYRQYRAALEQERMSAAKQRQNRWFHVINAGQWIVMPVLGNVLANVGLSDWVIPAAMFIVGLHFLPLARLFSKPSHVMTGGPLILLSGSYPFVAASGASSPLAAWGPE